jgi:glycosyltransferase involved in cell wall biosynthesis
MIDGIPVFRLPIPGPVPVAALTFTAAAMPLIQRLRPDVVHAHELFSPATTALAARRLFGTPVVATAHRSGPLGDVERMQNRPFGMRRLRAIRNEIDCFTTISSDVDRELDGLGIEPHRRRMIANAVDIDRFAPVSPESRRERRAALNLPDGPLVVFAGRLAPEKRINVLINCWPAIRQSFPDAHVLVLGTGPEEATLKAQSGAGVIFGGAVDDVVPYLQAADVWTLPSAAEGFSVAMLEALACGLPIVLTDVGGARDAVVDGEHGLLVPPDDPTALEAALMRVLGDPELRARLGRNGRERVVQSFSLPAVASALRDVYQELAGSTR